jgi:hypothetical protein
MNDLERNQLAALVRVHDLGAQHPTLFPAGKLTGELMAIIDSVVEQLQAHTTTQATSTSAARQGSASKNSARSALRDDLEMINLAAHAMALDDPSLIARFRIPHGNDHELLIAARVFAAAARPMKNEFIRFGMPEDFLEDLDADITAFEQATAARNQGVENQAASVAAIDTVLARGMKALKQLDLILRIVLKDDVGMRTAWMTASHVERVPHRRKKPSAPAPPPAPSKPAQ